MSIEILRPNAAGTYENIEYATSGAGNHWQDVDEEEPDGTTTDVQSDAYQEWIKDSYNLGPSSIPADSIINSVKVYFCHYTDGGPNGNIKPLIIRGGIEVDGTSITSTNSWVTNNEILSRPGGGTWTVADLADLEVGILLYSITGNWVHLTQIYVEVDYTEPVWEEPSVLRPNAAGDETAIPIQYPDEGYHWDKVDDVTPDEDDTYVGTADDSSTAVYRDLYNLPAVDGSVGINRITVYARARRSVAGSSYALGLDMRIGGTTYSSSLKSINDSYADYSEVWETNPNTGVPWTWDDIDSLQIGCRLRTGDGAVAIYTRCTQVWVEIELAPKPVADGDLIGAAVIRKG
jgi:hypothetical protein